MSVTVCVPLYRHELIILETMFKLQKKNRFSLSYRSRSLCIRPTLPPLLREQVLVVCWWLVHLAFLQIFIYFVAFRRNTVRRSALSMHRNQFFFASFFGLLVLWSFAYEHHSHVSSGYGCLLKFQSAEQFTFTKKYLFVLRLCRKVMDQFSRPERSSRCTMRNLSFVRGLYTVYCFIDVYGFERCLTSRKALLLLPNQ